MKYRLVLVGMILILVLGLLACQSGNSTETSKTTSSLTGYAAATMIKYYTCTAFEKKPNVAEEITFPANKGVTVRLCSNQTTGFQWSEPEISDTSVIDFTEHSYTPPVSDEVGAAGTEKFVFLGVNPGTTTVYLEYSQPWEGGEKAVWTCTLTIIVE
jgi:predicted secreted protein